MPSDVFIDDDDGWTPSRPSRPSHDPSVHYFHFFVTPRIYTSDHTNDFNWPFGNVSAGDTSQFNFYAQPAFRREVHLTIHGEITDETYHFLANSGIFPGMTPDEIRQALEENGETSPPTEDESPTDSGDSGDSGDDALSEREYQRLQFMKWQLERGLRNEFSEVSSEASTE